MEVLFDNPFLVIILIFVISSFFKKKKGKAGDPKTQKRNNYPPERRKHQQSGPFKEVRDILQELTRSLQEDTRPPGGKVDPVYDKKQEQVVQTIEESGSQKDVPYMPKPQPAAREIQQNKEMSVDEAKLADAVIWAEILGPPRAKKPHWKTKNRY